MAVLTATYQRCKDCGDTLVRVTGINMNTGHSDSELICNHCKHVQKNGCIETPKRRVKTYPAV